MNKRKNDMPFYEIEQIPFSQFPMNKPKIKSYPTSQEHVVYLYGPIESAENYIEIVNILDTMSESDVMNLHISTPGGDVDSAIVIIHAIRRCQGNVIGHADGQVMSAGVPIFLSCKQYAINPFATFMIHDGSYGSHSKANEHVKSAQAFSSLLRKVFSEILIPVFNEDEINQILDGIDLYVTADDMRDRISDAFEKQLETTIEKEEETV